MAIKGAYTWRGINLPEAYVRIANVQGNPRDGFAVEFCIYSSQEFAADDANKFKMMQGAQIRLETKDPTQVFAEGYAAIKQRPEMANFIDC
jgi:hypothetical protein